MASISRTFRYQFVRSTFVYAIVFPSCDSDLLYYSYYDKYVSQTTCPNRKKIMSDGIHFHRRPLHLHLHRLLRQPQSTAHLFPATSQMCHRLWLPTYWFYCNIFIFICIRNSMGKKRTAANRKNIIQWMSMWCVAIATLHNIRLCLNSFSFDWRFNSSQVSASNWPILAEWIHSNFIEPERSIGWKQKTLTFASRKSNMFCTVWRKRGEMVCDRMPLFRSTSE